MAFATISLIPQQYEWPFWLVIFLFCAYTIAKVCTGSFFLQGFLVGLINCIWITIVHFIFFATYMAHHPAMATMLTAMPPSVGTHPRLVIAVGGLFYGVIAALVLGLIAFIASKIFKKPGV